MAPVKISVVTVCLNCEGSIAGTIRSFLAQRHEPKELIVIDGGSSDRTVAIVEAFKDPRIRLYSEPDQGLYDAMNKGLDRFAGDAVGFLNADDRYHDGDALSEIAAALAEVDIVSGNLRFVRDHESGKIVRQWRGTPYRPGAFRRGWMPAHPTFYARRAVVDAVGQFDLTYQIAADYDYMLQAFELHDFAARHIDRVFVDMRAGGRSTKSPFAYVRSNLESLASRRRWLGSGIVDYALFAKPLGKLGQFALMERHG